MAKAILEFNLDDIDDGMAFSRATKSLDMALVLWELTTNLKRKISDDLEYNMALENYEKFDILNLVFDRIHELVNDKGIDVERLIR